jgi:hypothetical protein
VRIAELDECLWSNGKPATGRSIALHARLTVADGQTEARNQSGCRRVRFAAERPHHGNVSSTTSNPPALLAGR